MAKTTGLGKGLGALIPGWQEDGSLDSTPSGQIPMIPINQIRPNPHQPRKTFNQENLTELANSIREHGIIQPLIVISDGPNRYTLIAGERRLRAAKIAGLKEVPALVRTASEQEQLEFAIIENVQREDLNPMERARAFQRLIDDFSLSHEEVAQRVGKSRVTVTNTLRLLNLPLSVQQAVLSENLSEGHARALLALPNPRAMENAMETVISLGLNVRQTELLVNKTLGRGPAKTSRLQRTPELESLENELRQHFNTKVNLVKSKNGGSITLFFYSDEELNAIVDRFGLYD
ncbi:MAG TPA: ParB/RepB/Spo0J family partition protein [Anaerolineaceae bacterium]|jgi:ParB family chromosome partitioning protein|nr:ParB/RepB/Spo0J family partition protein [Chloroflexota bacterium]HPL82061.1 ParB/RepB/Spo0J family partition protein [Anaerolineaceae bacterium]